MILKQADYYTYLDNHQKLMYYVGSKVNCIQENVSYIDFLNFPALEKIPAKRAIYDNLHLIDEYIRDHSKVLSNEDIDIVNGFKEFRQGKYVITKYAREHALFMDKEYVFGVLALRDSFESFWSKKELPIYVETVLLPYKGKIIYDGFFINPSVQLGRNVSNNLMNEADIKIRNFGIVLNLPIDEKLKEKKLNQEELLMQLMKTKSSRELNKHKIQELVIGNYKLRTTYLRELGRINSRKKKKELRSLGIKNHYFAMHINTILTSGQSKSIVHKNIRAILKDERKISSVFYFKV